MHLHHVNHYTTVLIRFWDRWIQSLFDHTRSGSKSFQGQILFFKWKRVFHRGFWKNGIYYVCIWFDPWIKVAFRSHQKVEPLSQMNLTKIKNDPYWEIYELKILIEHDLALWYFSQGIGELRQQTPRSTRYRWIAFPNPPKKRIRLCYYIMAAQKSRY